MSRFGRAPAATRRCPRLRFKSGLIPLRRHLVATDLSMADTASKDRISELSDDLLAHILSFAPAKEAASTAVLSRRWRDRSLWLQSGALNLDTRSYDRAYGPRDDDEISQDGTKFLAVESRIPDKRRAFSYGAHQALDALRRRHHAAPPLRRITVTAAEQTYGRCGEFVDGVLPGVLRLPAASRLEELRVTFIPSLGLHSEVDRGAMYALCPGSLPCAKTLRVLDLTDCTLQPSTPRPPPPPMMAMPPPMPPLPPPPLPHPNNYIPRHYMFQPRMPPPPPPMRPLPPPPLPHPNNYIPRHYMFQPRMPLPPHLFRPSLPPQYAMLDQPPLPQPTLLPFTGFPSLTALRLHCCKLALDDLQAMIRAAPRLASLRLETVRFDGMCRDHSTKSLHLHCHTATDLVLVFDTSCYFSIVELDVPQLCSFRYAGPLVQGASFSLKSPTPHLMRVDLDLMILTLGEYYSTRDVNHGASFWRFLASICHCKSLKLNSSCIKNAIINPDEEAKLLPVFTNLDRLELKATYRHGDHKDVVTLLSYLLRCCPIISELKINLTVTPIPAHSKRNRKAGLNRDQKARLAFKRSAHKFRMHSSFTRMSFLPHDDNNGAWDFPDLPGWKEFSFACLRNSLSKLFVYMEQQDGFEIQLIRYFVENALLLKEVYIGDGDQDLRTHINYKLAQWRANSLKRNPSMKPEFKVYDQRECEVPSYVYDASKDSRTFESRPMKRQKTRH